MTVCHTQTSSIHGQWLWPSWPCDLHFWLKSGSTLLSCFFFGFFSDQTSSLVCTYGCPSRLFPHAPVNCLSEFLVALIENCKNKHCCGRDAEEGLKTEVWSICVYTIITWVRSGFVSDAWSGDRRVGKVFCGRNLMGVDSDTGIIQVYVSICWASLFLVIIVSHISLCLFWAIWFLAETQWAITFCKSSAAIRFVAYSALALIIPYQASPTEQLLPIAW